MITFKLAPHMLRDGQHVVEVWNGDAFVGQITAGDDDDTAVRVISKHRLGVHVLDGGRVTVVQITIAE